jgi:hypothetical protein
VHTKERRARHSVAKPRAVTLYTHTADQYSVYASRVIACTPREASYVLDGILENETVLPIREHITDTHGFTEQLFGLCAILGIRFMPRLKDLPDQVLYRLDRNADHGALRPLLRGTVDTALIIEQWDQLVRIAASLKDRLTPAHVIMQRLINVSPADRVAKALTTLGRLVKTIHLLRYIHHDPSLALHPRRAASAPHPPPAQSRRAPPCLGQMAVLRQPGCVPHRRLRGDHEQGELPEPFVQRGAGLEHRADRAHRARASDQRPCRA